MPTLTNELNDRSSPLYRWFESKHNAAGDRLIVNHNQAMSGSHIIRPPGRIEDFGLLGTAFVYAYRWHLGILAGNFHETPANYFLSHVQVNSLFAAKTSREKAIACLIFAAFEVQYRCGHLHEIGSVLLAANDKKIKPELSYASVMVEDLVNLIDSIDFFGDSPLTACSKASAHLNPTFAGSEYISADGQQIVNGCLIKCFTTLKRSPFNRRHLWQQIAYVLMDWDNRYKISAVSWYYSRQKAVFTYPVERLFKNLPSLRREFKSFILDTYDEDWDYDSPFTAKEFYFCQ